ncbi:M23 family metallopeptidase [bacterium]|nr:M23 family metallopeptidase [bacterium]
MLRERFRLMYMPKQGTAIRQISLNGNQLYWYSISGGVALFVLVAVIIGVFTRFYHNYRIVSLKKDREHLQRELLTIKDQVLTLSSRISQIEKAGNELRNAAHLQPIDDDIRRVGVGGPNDYSFFDFAYYPDEISRTAQEIQLDLSKLFRDVSLERSNFAEITNVLKEQENRIDHLPSIMPVLGGRINDRFGIRFHPVIRRMQHHPGVDIPMPVGTKVLATADGVVKEVCLRPRMHKEYGIYIVIDHGYGYTTKYAHLSNVLVRPGQKVLRWEPIGEVGNTGRTTGYHLHYEVALNNERVDPELHIFN